MTDINQLLKQLFPRWQSHLIQEAEDDYGKIFVIEAKHTRVMTFGSNFEQSSMDTRRPYLPVHKYIRAMLLPLAFNKPNHITLLGLGGGAIARCVYHLLPSCKQQAVELRPLVAKLAKQHFLIDPTLIKITIDHAHRYIAEVQEKATDFIFVDIYLASGMDLAQRSQRFIQHCSNALSDHGWLVLNYTNLPHADDPCFDIIRQNFSALYICAVDTENYIVIAGKLALPKPLPEYYPELAQLEQKLDSRLTPFYRRLTDFDSFFGLGKSLD